MKYLVSYDLMDEGQDYPRSTDELNHNLVGHKVLQSQWIVESNMNTTELLHHLLSFVDHNDRLLIVRLPDDLSIRVRDGIDWINVITNPDTL